MYRNSLHSYERHGEQRLLCPISEQYPVISEISGAVRGNFQFCTHSVCQGGDRSSGPKINLGSNERQALCSSGWHNCKLFLIMGTLW